MCADFRDWISDVSSCFLFLAFTKFWRYFSRKAKQQQQQRRRTKPSSRHEKPEWPSKIAEFVGDYCPADGTEMPPTEQQSSEAVISITRSISVLYLIAFAGSARSVQLSLLNRRCTLEKPPPEALDRKHRMHFLQNFLNRLISPSPQDGAFRDALLSVIAKSAKDGISAFAAAPSKEKNKTRLLRSEDIDRVPLATQINNVITRVRSSCEEQVIQILRHHLEQDFEDDSTKPADSVFFRRLRADSVSVLKRDSFWTLFRDLANEVFEMLRHNLQSACTSSDVSSRMPDPTHPRADRVHFILQQLCTTLDAELAGIASSGKNYGECVMRSKRLNVFCLSA